MIVRRLFGRSMEAVCLVVCLSFSPAIVAAQQASAAKPLDKAYELSKTARTEAQYAEVIRLCQEAQQGTLSPKQTAYVRQLTAWAHNRRGELFADTGFEQEALADFVAAVELEPSNWRALHNRGVSFATAGQYAEAAADFDAVLKTKPDFAAAWFNRGELRSQQEDFRSAVSDYDRALKLDPNDAAVLSARGHAYYQQGNVPLALADLNKAIQLEKSKALAYLYRAAALADSGKYAEAADDYRTGIRLEPKSAAAYQATAWMMATCADERFRDPQLAIKAAERAIALREADDYHDQETLAAAYASAGQFDQAVMAQQKAIDILGPEATRLKPALEDRLKLYQQQRPYHEVREARKHGGTVRRAK